MSDIKFKFSNEKQRKINIGREVDPREAKIRQVGRHTRPVKVNLTLFQLYYDKRFSVPDGIEIHTLPLKDSYGHFITPDMKEYLHTFPVTIRLVCSDTNPDYLERFNEYDLHAILTETFGKYIITETFSKSELPEKDDRTYIQSGMLQTNEATGQDFLNKNAFNVTAEPIKEVDLENLNERLAIMGFKVKKTDALMVSEHNINTPREYYFEIGDF